MHLPATGALAILIVDDHEALRRSLRLWLEASLPAAELHEAASGEEALALVAARRFHAVLMDLSLPGIGGLEAARALLTRHPHTKIIAITQHDTFAHRRNAEEAGCHAFVPKSLLGSELVPALRQSLDLPQETP